LTSNPIIAKALIIPVIHVLSTVRLAPPQPQHAHPVLTATIWLQILLAARLPVMLDTMLISNLICLSKKVINMVKLH
jgi:hypothetical protein